MADAHSKQNPVEVLAEEFAKRIRRGEHPSITDYVERYPDHADEIQSLFPSIAMMEQLKQQKQASHERRPGTVKTPADMPKQLGDFRVLREIGRGGMGIVYEAWQQSLARRVALKVLPTEGMGRSQKQIERFLREAKSAGRLHHTNIVPVFGVGQHGGIYYYVMQLIEGYGLDDLLEFHQLQHEHAIAETDGKMIPGNTEVSPSKTGQPRLKARTADVTRWTSDNTETNDAEGLPGPASHGHGGSDEASQSTLATGSASQLPLDWINIANIGIQVAHAVHYAHQHGILHRDIKPSNLLIDQDQNVWVTDFGLAKAAENNNLTQTGDVVGTLRYMAPEQFEGTSDAVSEVYSLGITLYELAALQPAFSQESRMELIRKIMEGSITPLRNLSPDIPRDLETIIQKATFQDSSQRYATALELAEDLQRFREDRPIVARRSSPLQKVQHWSRRNPALAISTLTTACLLLLVAITASSAYWVTSRALTKLSHQQEMTKDAKSEAVEKRKEAENQTRRAEKNLEVAMKAMEGIFSAVGRPQTPQHLTTFDDDQSLTATLHAPLVTPSEMKLLENLLTFYDQVSATNVDDVVLKDKRAEAHLRVGKIQLLLGHSKPAESAYRRALYTYRQLHREFPDNENYPIQAISVQNELGVLCRANGRLFDSVNEHRRALQLLNKLPETMRQIAPARFQLARTYNFLGLPSHHGPRRGKGDPGKAIQVVNEILLELKFHPVDLHLESQRILENLLQHDPHNATYQIERVHTLTNMIRVSNRSRPTLDPWRKWHEAIGILDDLLMQQPDNPTYLYEKALLYVYKLQRHGQPTPLNLVRDRLEEGIRICDRLCKRYQQVPDYKRLLALALYNRAEFELRNSNPRIGPDRLNLADDLIRETIGIERSLISQFPDALEHQIRLNQALHRLTEIHDQLGRTNDALSVLQGTIKELDRFLDEHPQYQDARRILIADYDLLAELLENTDQTRFAEIARDKAKKLRDQFQSQKPGTLP